MAEGLDLPDLSAALTLDLSSLDAAVGKATSTVDRISDGMSGAGQGAGAQLGEGITRGADGKLRDANGRFVASGRKVGDAVGRGADQGARSAFAGGFLGGILSGVAVNAVDSVTQFTTGSVDAFAQLEDATAAAGVLFGSEIGTITAAAEDAASRVGISSQAYIDAAGVFGTLGKSAGLQGPALSGFGTQMSNLAGDLASFKGTTPEEAIEAVGAALRGEAEPIRRYGVLLDDATLRAQAMKMGLISTTKEALTPQQKVLAAQAAILAQTADAQGDFARTSDSTANTQKRVAAETANAQAQLGEKLAPALTGLRLILLSVITSLSDLITWVQGNIDILGPLAAGIAIITVALSAHVIWLRVVAAATRAWAAVQAILNVVMTANPIGIVIAVIVALVVAIVIAYRRSETFRQVVQTAFAAIQQSITLAMNGARVIVGAVMAFIQGNVTGKMAVVRAVVGAVFRFITGIIGSQLAAARAIIAGVLNVIVGLFTGDFGRARDGAVQALRGLLRFLTTVPRAILGALGNLGGLLLGAGGDLVRGLVNGITGMAGRAADAARNAAKAAVNAAKSALGISSPSKVFHQIGEDTSEGLALGIADRAGRVAAEAAGLVDAAMPAMSDLTGTVRLATGADATTPTAVGPQLVALTPATIAALAAAIPAPLLQILLDSDPIAFRVNEKLGSEAASIARGGGF